MDCLFMGQLMGFLGKYFGLRFVNQTKIPLIRHVFFVEVVKEFGFCLNLLRTDTGTENREMARIQCRLRESKTTRKYGFELQVSELKTGGAV